MTIGAVDPAKFQSPRSSSSSEPEFDKFADSYRDSVNSTLELSGEDSDYFAAGRVTWLKRILSDEHGIRNIMDYGCGIGLGTPHLLTLPGVSSLIGVDVSEKSLDVARASYGSSQAQFFSFKEYKPTCEIDLVVCCSVFHHIPPEDRREAVQYIFDSLRSGGLFALWEHNPWNPGVVYIMKNSPIDKDAVLVKPHQAQRMLRRGGFSLIQTNYLFFFPAFLRIFRFMEPALTGIPMGAQYLVLGRKP